MKSSTKTLLAAIGTYACATAVASADMVVEFDEGAPKDRFTFANSGSCSITNAQVTLDLSGSKSGLIFDVTASGAGVEVFQPLEIVTGADALQSVPTIKDGDNRITLDLGQLDGGQNIAFTIDVDDTMGGREITVSGSEIAGALVRFSQNGKSETAVFGSNARATVKMQDCEL